MRKIENEMLAAVRGFRNWSSGNTAVVRHRSPDGAAICNVSIATTSTWKDKATGEKREETEWHRVVFYNRLAEIAELTGAQKALRVGVLGGLAALGAQTQAVDAFEAAVKRAAGLFGAAGALDFDIAPLDIAATRRAALLMMEAELLAAHGESLRGASERVLEMLAFAQKKSASDFARADLRLDAHVVRMRQLFERFDVLLLPVAPQLPPACDAMEPGNLADFTALASLAGCPAVSLPLAEGAGLQLVGLPGSDLRLLELGALVAAVAGVDGAG